MMDDAESQLVAEEDMLSGDEKIPDADEIAENNTLNDEMNEQNEEQEDKDSSAKPERDNQGLQYIVV